MGLILSEEVVAWLCILTDPIFRKSGSGEAKEVLSLKRPGSGLRVMAHCLSQVSWFLLQTPYFWPTQQWPAEDTDYGKTLPHAVGGA